jgi:hypothetical protein
MFSAPADRETGMPDVATILSHNLTSAGITMGAALAGIGLKDMVRDPGLNLRNLDSLLGEATMALRDTLLAIGREDLPEVPDGFEARYARWGTGAEVDEAVPGLRAIFPEHLEALADAVRGLENHRFDEASNYSSAAFDDDGFFSFATIGEMIFSVSSYVQFLAGEASVIRLGLGKLAASDPFDELFGGAE